MATTSKKTAADAAADKDFISRLADAGEEALHRLTELPGGQKAVAAVNELKERVDDLARKVRGIDALETRVAELEKEVAALKKAQKPAARRTATRKPPAKP